RWWNREKRLGSRSDSLLAVKTDKTVVMALPQWRALYAQSITIGSTDRLGNQKLPRLVSIATPRTARQPTLRLPVRGWSDSPVYGLNDSLFAVPMWSENGYLLVNHVVD